MCQINTVKGCKLCDASNIVIFRACKNFNDNISSCNDIYNYDLDDNEFVLYVHNEIPSMFITVCGNCAYKVRNNYEYFEHFDIYLSNKSILLQYIIAELLTFDSSNEIISAVGAYEHENGHPVALICGFDDV